MIGKWYPNDDTSWVIVFPSSMVCGTNLLNLPTYSSLSHVFPLNLTLTQNSAARFQKNAKFCSVIRRLTIIKPRPGLSSCHPGGVRLQRWAFWGGWTLGKNGKNVRNLIFPSLLFSFLHHASENDLEINSVWILLRLWGWWGPTRKAR